MAEARSTGELLAAGVAGDEAAWAVLVKRLSPAIWGATRSAGLNAAQAEDVSQTVWLRLIDHHADIRDPERLAGWISQTARREAIATKKGQDRVIPSELLDLRESPVDGPEIESERTAITKLVWEGFEQLDEKCRLLLRLLVSKVAYKEVAAMLNIAVGSIGPTRKRCLTQLRSTSPVKQVLETST